MIIGIQLSDDELRERARPRELRRMCGKQPHGTRTKLVAPALRIEPLFGPEGFLQVAVDIGDEWMDPPVIVMTSGHLGQAATIMLRRVYDAPMSGDIEIRTIWRTAAEQCELVIGLFTGYHVHLWVKSQLVIK